MERLMRYDRNDVAHGRSAGKLIEKDCAGRGPGNERARRQEIPTWEEALDDFPEIRGSPAEKVK